jgi:hypothetical protein
MKIEIGLDDRTILSLDKLTYALQQLVRPECHYHPPADTDTPAPPAPPCAPVRHDCATPVDLGSDVKGRVVTDDDLRAATQQFISDPAIPKDKPGLGKDTFAKFLKAKYGVLSLRELPRDLRPAVMEDMAKGFAAAVAFIGATE